MPSQHRASTKRQANGQPKKKGISVEKEKTICDLMEQFDDEAADINEADFDEEKRAWTERAANRRLQMEAREFRGQRSRRTDYCRLDS